MQRLLKAGGYTMKMMNKFNDLLAHPKVDDRMKIECVVLKTKRTSEVHMKSLDIYAHYFQFKAETIQRRWPTLKGMDRVLNDDILIYQNTAMAAQAKLNLMYYPEELIQPDGQLDTNRANAYSGSVEIAPCKLAILKQEVSIEIDPPFSDIRCGK